MRGELVSYVDSNTYSREGGTKVELYVMDEGKSKYMSYTVSIKPTEQGKLCIYSRPTQQGYIKRGHGIP